MRYPRTTQLGRKATLPDRRASKELPWRELDIDVCMRQTGRMRSEPLRSPEEVTAFIEEAFPEMRHGGMREYFVVVCLNQRHIPIGIYTISIGSLNQTIVHPREAFRPAVMLPAAAVIFSHNHPSGDPTPSPEDREVTARLEESGRILGIKMLDHVIIGRDSFWSFNVNGAIKK